MGRNSNVITTSKLVLSSSPGIQTNPTLKRRVTLTDKAADEDMFSREEVLAAFDRMIADACKKGFPHSLPVDSLIFNSILPSFLPGFAPRRSPFRSYRDIVHAASEEGIIDTETDN